MYYPSFTVLSSLLNQWQQFGVFTVVMPLILIFAVIYAILEKANLFKNRGVHMIIALAVAFFTVSNPFISSYFLPLFSNLGLGIAILLVFIVLLGFILPEDETKRKTFYTIFGILGGILFLFVIGKAGIFNALFGDGFNLWISQNAAWIIIFVFVALMIGAVLMFGNNSHKKKTHKYTEEEN